MLARSACVWISLAFVTLLSPIGYAQSQCGVLVADDFEDGVINSSHWNVLLTYPTSDVSELNGQLRLKNRGWLLTAGEFDAVALGGLRVTGYWTPQTANDVLQVCTRSNGVAGGPSNDIVHGVRYGFWAADANHHVYAAASGVVSVGGYQATGQITAVVGATYYFDLLELASSAVFSVSQVGAPSNSQSISVYGIGGLPSDDLIVFNNREHIGGDHVALLDNVEIRQPVIGSGVPYCTAGTTVHGCTPSIAGSGTASASAPSGFDIVVSNVPGQRYGTMFYGFYPFATPWAPGSLSYQCIAAPVQRFGVQDTGGVAGQCNGELRLDFNAWRAANPGALGTPFVAGQVFHAQGWFRDPGAPKQTNLSDGLRFVLCD